MHIMEECTVLATCIGFIAHQCLYYVVLRINRFKDSSAGSRLALTTDEQNEDRFRKIRPLKGPVKQGSFWG